MTGSVPVTKMGSTNDGVHWPAKRLPLNRDGNSASDSRQVGEPLSSPRPLEPGEHPTEETLSSPLSSFSRPHDLRQGAARGTRSARRKEIVSAFTWEALTIGKARTGELATSSGNSKGPRQLPIAVAPPNTPPSKMSRNRPRGPPLPRDNGLAANEETDMWNKILQDLRKAKEKNDKQKSLAEQISALNEKIGKDGGSNLYRQMLKLCEDERAILQDEPSDVIKNLGLLTALRQASEAEAPLNRAAALGKSRKKRNDVDGSATDSPGPSGASLPDKAGRIKGGIQRGSSVSSNQARDSRDSRDVHVKVEEGTEGTKGTLAERNGHLVVGAEPNENGEEGAVYKTTAAFLIPIPQVGSTLPSFSVGKQVLARYPDTTTFYRAEVMGSRKDTYRLKFEGEEDDKEMEVDRRFVLDIPGK
ncbi:unnamed protein product [Aspergillus oryzae]|uniref:Unnamed protein product n=2 Tax=Aspergillus oryzae TaxID=5062 RepID=A0AAN5BVS0_ASPOZ|nr:unnamed protein product [Aspergillus oryzae]GMF88076.1 unnamed protein product [Aspergillus oryzae]GMG28535.1 unnamed protein product [Aspergillus oryzae]GMG45680.1 unnamed protein product [Aspergillus oryzae var. brunneus]